MELMFLACSFSSYSPSCYLTPFRFQTSSLCSHCCICFCCPPPQCPPQQPQLEARREISVLGLFGCCDDHCSGPCSFPHCTEYPPQWRWSTARRAYSDQTRIWAAAGAIPSS